MLSGERGWQEPGADGRQQDTPEGLGCGREMTSHHPGGREVPGEAAARPGASTALQGEVQAQRDGTW